MTEIESIVLEHLRHIRGAIDGVRDDMHEVKQRLGSLEREVAQVHVKIAELSERADRLGNRIERIERIERRLELSEVQ